MGPRQPRSLQTRPGHSSRGDHQRISGCLRTRSRAIRVVRLGRYFGRWFPCLRDIAEELLLDLPLTELVAAAETENLTRPQLDGTARLFGGWSFGRRYSAHNLPSSLKKKLLDHALKSPNQDKVERAKRAFAP